MYFINVYPKFVYFSIRTSIICGADPDVASYIQTKGICYKVKATKLFVIITMDVFNLRLTVKKLLSITQ